MKNSRLAFIIAIGVLSSSCSHDIYNNKNFVKTANLTGKRLAILPPEVYFTGNLAKGFDLSQEEQSASLSLQNGLSQSLMLHSSRHGIKGFQRNIKVLDINSVNAILKQKGIDLHTVWSLAPDSLAKLTGADLVLKVRMTSRRFMSENAATGINTTASIIDVVTNTNSNGFSFLPRVKSTAVDYSVTLIDVQTNTVVSSGSNHPEKDKNGSTIGKLNEKMASKSVIYAGS